MIGTTVSHYRIAEKLGQGGMGEVFLAEDTQLDRRVALKVLPEEMASDPERLERFKREARAVAALNHPNIVTLYSVEDADGLHLLTMELVEGESLDRVLPRDGLDLEPLFDLGLQIADGLAAAHEKGITHRDLKPANVMVTPEGRVKLLDFGLAKLAAAEPDEAQTTLLTQEGSFLGTPHYMSPEQIQGKAVDPRSDVFSLGVLLYEMATGVRPFRGDNPASIISSVLKDQPPPLAEVKRRLPTHLGRILRRCLDKRPERRYPSALDVKIELEDLQRELSAATGVAETKAGVATDARPPMWWLPWALAAVTTLLALWLAVSPRGGQPPTGGSAELAAESRAKMPPTAWALAPPENGVFVTSAGRPALSPDGSQIVFVARQGDAEKLLYLRRLDATELVPLRGTEGGQYPFWSPDSRHIGFFVDDRLLRLDTTTGSVENLVEPVSLFGAASWSPDGTILFGSTDGRTLTLTDPSGEVRALVPGERLGDEIYSGPSFLPDGERFVFLLQDIAGGRPQGIYVASTKGGDAQLVAAINSSAQLTESGYLTLWRDGALRAVRFDFESESTVGELRRLVDGVSFSPFDLEPHYSIQNDVLVYLPGDAIWPGQLKLFDRSGETVRRIGPSSDYYSPRFSPDGSHIAVDKTSIDPAGGDIWTFDTRSGAALRITSDPQNESDPVWSPDGRELVFQRGPDLYRQLATGAGEAALLVDDDPPLEPCDWSADGRYILYSRGVGDDKDVWVLDLETDKKKPVLASPFVEDNARFSPDGNWLAYQSNESDQTEIYVVDWPEMRQKLAVSLGEGSIPVWTGNGREILFYSVERGVLSVAVDLDGRLSAEPPEVLFAAPAKLYEKEAEFDASADGRSFIMAQAVEATSMGPIIVRTGWRALLDD